MLESRAQVTRASGRLEAQEPRSRCLPDRISLWRNLAPETGLEKHPAQAERRSRRLSQRAQGFAKMCGGQVNLLA